MEEQTTEEETTCPLGICDGSGEVSCMDTVWPGEPHMADVGTRKCECRLEEEEDDDSELDEEL